jgi:hypothetical protein
MSSGNLREGEIFHYPYLWKWQRELDRFEGEKDRPACLALMLRDESKSLTHLVILAISGTPPRADQTAIEIPVLELRRAGLSDAKQGWITVSEYNYDILERSWNFPPNAAPIGHFSAAFTRRVQEAVLSTIRRKAGRIDRTE